MAYFLFIDESGQDHHDSPYEVLAGVAMLDKDLWTFIQTAHDLELSCFGRKYRTKDNEIKATKFLKKKTFRLAAQLPPIALEKRTILAKQALDDGEHINIIPEPFFVHSDLTTGIQVVDFVAYILSWNFRVEKLDKPGREELNSYLDLLKSLRYRTTREIGEIQDHIVWSVCVV